MYLFVCRSAPIRLPSPLFIYPCARLPQQPASIWEEAKARVQQKKLVVSFTFPRALAPSSAAAGLKEVGGVRGFVWLGGVGGVLLVSPVLYPPVRGRVYVLVVCTGPPTDVALFVTHIAAAGGAAVALSPLPVSVRSEMSEMSVSFLCT